MCAWSIRPRRSSPPRTCWRETQTLYAAGADYVTIARLDQANELVEVVTAAEAGLLDDMRAKLDAQLRDRREILP